MSTQIVDMDCRRGSVVQMPPTKDFPMSPSQCRAARALVDVSQERLAELAGVGVSTVRDFEAGRRSPRVSSIEAMRACLERLGVVLIDLHETSRAGGAGVRLSGKHGTVAKTGSKNVKSKGKRV